MTWYRRRQERRAAARAARVLVALDRLAASRGRPRKAHRASLSTIR